MCQVSVTFAGLTSYQIGLLVRMSEVLESYPVSCCGREQAEEELSAMQLERLKTELETTMSEFVDTNFPRGGGGNDPPDT